MEVGRAHGSRYKAATRTAVNSSSPSWHLAWAVEQMIVAFQRPNIFCWHTENHVDNIDSLWNYRRNTLFNDEFFVSCCHKNDECLVYTVARQQDHLNFCLILAKCATSPKYF